MVEIFGEKMCAVIIHTETAHMEEKHRLSDIFQNLRELRRLILESGKTIDDVKAMLS